MDLEAKKVLIRSHAKNIGGGATLVVFDGVCNLCNGWVQFLLKHDPLEQFYFATAQSEVGHQIMSAAGALELASSNKVSGDKVSGDKLSSDKDGMQASVDPYQSFVVVTDYLGQQQSELLSSSAVMALLKRLPWTYRWLSIGGFLPDRMLDFCYSIVAKNRYRWFGKRPTCKVPTESERLRFLDDA